MTPYQNVIRVTDVPRWENVMSIGLTRCLIAVGLWASHGASLAQEQMPPGDQSTIVVTGSRDSEQDVKDFVRALTPAPVGARLSRFEQAVCPFAVGLPVVQRDLLVSRMRRVATETGIAVGGAKCFPNVVVMVADDKRALLKELRRKHSNYFGQLSLGRIRDLDRHPGPAVAWHLQGPPLSARGTETFFDDGIGAYVNRTTEPESRLYSSGRPQFEGAVVVVERKALKGLTVTQLADYAAMRAFAGSNPARLGQSGLTTILGVLDAPPESQVPLSLTATDFAFLRSYYSAPRNLHASAQRSAIGRSMTKDAERRDPN